MRSLEEIRKANRREFSPLSKVDNTPVKLTEEQYEEGRKQYEEFVKPISQRVFARQLTI
jgi:hypothetical protein